MLVVQEAYKILGFHFYYPFQISFSSLKCVFLLIEFWPLLSKVSLMFVVWLCHFKGLLRPLPVGSDLTRKRGKDECIAVSKCRFMLTAIVLTGLL